MYVISKFKDYYDVMPNTKDDPPTWVRKTQHWGVSGDRLVIIDDTPNILNIDYLFRKATPTKPKPETKEEFERRQAFVRWSRVIPNAALPTFDNSHLGFIVFCGVRYPFYEVDGKTCFNLDQVIAAVEESLTKNHHYTRFNKDTLKRLNNENRTKLSQWTRPPLNRGNWARYLERLEAEPNYLCIDHDVHRFFDSPVLLWQGREKVTTNPLLRDHGFAGQIDPYTAYQELDMFCSNTFTTPESPDLQMTEADKVHSKGMDRWSFRTMPGDSGKPRKKGK